MCRFCVNDEEVDVFEFAKALFAALEDEEDCEDNDCNCFCDCGCEGDCENCNSFYDCMDMDNVFESDEEDDDDWFVEEDYGIEDLIEDIFTILRAPRSIREKYYDELLDYLKDNIA